MAPSPHNLNPDQFRHHVANVNNFYEATPADVAKAGSAWYSRVHDMVDSETKGTSLSPRAGAGIVASTSPGVDWSSANKNVLGDWKSLKTDDFNRLKANPQDRGMLKGTSINKSPTPNILKAQRIADGEDPEDVLQSGGGGYKTHSFFHNIADPSDPHPVTVDGRAYDIAKNRMTGWTANRGIASPSKPSKANYDHMANAYRAVAAAQSEKQGKPVLPNQVQAVTWEHGKHVELSTPKKDGTKRVKGPTRVGQPYF